MKNLTNRSLPIKTFLLITILSISEIASAQFGWVGIGNVDNITLADTTSSALIIESFRKGILLPRLSDQVIGGLDMPPEGLFLYNTDAGVVQVNSGSSSNPDWSRLSSGWNLKGNDGTDYLNNGDFIGTKDAANLVIGIYNDPVIYITPDGVGIGMGTNIPQQQLDVNGAINIGYSSAGSDGALRWSGSQFEGFNSQTGGWEPFGGGSDNDWTEGAGIVYNLSDQVGIGTATPANLLGVGGAMSIGSTYDSQVTATTDGLAVEGNVGIGNAGYDAVNLWVNSPATNTTNFIGIYNTQAADVSSFDCYSFFNSNSMTTTGTKWGIYNTVNSTGTGERQGIYNQTDGNSSSSEIIYGYKGETNSAGSGTSYSMYLDNVSGGSGTDYGIYTVGEDINYFEGKVGIGNTNAYYKLYVESDEFSNTTYSKNTRASGGSGIRGYCNNSLSPTSGTRYGGYFGGWYGQGVNYGVYGYGYAGTTSYGVYGQGQNGSTNYGVYGKGLGSNNYGVFGIASGGYAIYSNGTQASTTSAYWTSVSDRKMKNNIQDLNINALETILKFKTRTFMYKHEEYPHMQLPTEEQWGFIAQEVGEIIPEMERDITHPAEVDEDGNELHPEVKLKGLNLDRLNPLFIKAFQEQQAMIEEMQLKITKLESKLAELSDK